MKFLLFMSFLSLWRGSDETGADPVNVVVKEGDDVMLPCSFSSSSSIRNQLFDWNKDRHKDQKEVFMYDRGDIEPSRQDETFRGRVSHFPDQLDVGNASIVIRDTKVTDSGTYTCIFPDPQPARESNIVLVVNPILKDRRDENISGAAQEPSVTILNETKDWALLRCVVRGAFPKPKVYWQDGNKSLVPAEEPQVTERGGRYDIILQTTVTKTDLYHCVATQEEIHHQTNAEIFVLMNDTPGTLPDAAGVPDGAVPVWAVAVVGLVVGAVLTLLVVGLVLFMRKRKQKSRPDHPDSSEGASLKKDVC